MADPIYNNSDQVLGVTVFDTDGQSILPATGFSDATYSIFPTDSCTAILTKTLGAGIVANGNIFEVTILEADLTVSGTYKHQFRVNSAAGPDGAPVFDENVEIIDSCPV